MLKHEVAARVFVDYGFGLPSDEVAYYMVKALLFGSSLEPEVSVHLLPLNTVSDGTQVLGRIAVADPGDSLFLELLVRGLEKWRFEAFRVN